MPMTSNYREAARGPLLGAEGLQIARLPRSAALPAPLPLRPCARRFRGAAAPTRLLTRRGQPTEAAGWLAWRLRRARSLCAAQHSSTRSIGTAARLAAQVRQRGSLYQTTPTPQRRFRAPARGTNTCAHPGRAQSGAGVQFELLRGILTRVAARGAFPPRRPRPRRRTPIGSRVQPSLCRCGGGDPAGARSL